MAFFLGAPLNNFGVFFCRLGVVTICRKVGSMILLARFTLCWPWNDFRHLFPAFGCSCCSAFALTFICQTVFNLYLPQFTLFGLRVVCYQQQKKKTKKKAIVFVIVSYQRHVPPQPHPHPQPLSSLKLNLVLS